MDLGQGEGGNGDAALKVGASEDPSPPVLAPSNWVDYLTRS